MNQKLPTQKSVFKVEKKHAWKDKFVKIVEIILVIIVILGTGFWLLTSAKFSFKDFLSAVSTALKPKITSNSATKNITPEQEIRELITQKRVLDIASLTKTSEGDFEAKSQTGQVVIFSKDKNIAEQVSTLQNLLAKAKIEGKSLKKADFRFSKIVVEY